MESHARYSKTNTIKEAASDGQMEFSSMALWAAQRREKTLKDKREAIPHLLISTTATFFNLFLFSFCNNHTANSTFGTFTHASVTWKESGCTVKHLPVSSRLQLQDSSSPALWQPASICSSSLTCLLTHRRLCWIEECNYGAFSLCWLLQQPGWGQSALHCVSKLMSQLVPVPSEIWQRLEPPSTASTG